MNQGATPTPWSKPLRLQGVAIKCGHGLRQLPLFLPLQLLFLCFGLGPVRWWRVACPPVNSPSLFYMLYLPQGRLRRLLKSLVTCNVLRALRNVFLTLCKTKKLTVRQTHHPQRQIQGRQRRQRQPLRPQSPSSSMMSGSPTLRARTTGLLRVCRLSCARARQWR